MNERWRDRAGTHCQQVHHALIEQGKLDLIHVQADERQVKGRSLIAWMGFSMMVSLYRDELFADLFSLPYLSSYKFSY